MTNPMTRDPGPTKAPLRQLLVASALGTVLAAAATELLTAIVRAAGIHLAVGDPGGDASSVVPVNAGACALSVFASMVLGTALAIAIRRWARTPATTYLRTAIVLVAVSLLAPTLAAATSGGTKVTLIAAHLLAAAIVLPIVTRSLARATPSQN